MWVRKDKSEKNDKSDKSAVEHASGAAPGDHNKQQSGNLSRVSLSLSDPVREAAQGQSERPLSQSDPASHAAGAAASPQPSHASVGPRLYSRVERKASFTRSLEVFVTGENIAKGRIEKTLLAIVMDEGRCEQFHRFLESRYMEEGLMCLLEILEFEMQPSVHRGKRLYDQYLASGAEKEVTVSHTDVENIRAQILAQKVPDFIAVKCEVRKSANYSFFFVFLLFAFLDFDNSVNGHGRFYRGCRSADGGIVLSRRAALWAPSRIWQNVRS